MSSVSSCGTTPRRARMAGPCSTGSMPRTRNVPALGGETQPIMRMVEDLPAPFGPRKPNASPRIRSKSIPSTAVKSPKRLVRPRACTRVAGDFVLSGVVVRLDGRGAAGVSHGRRAVPGGARLSGARLTDTRLRGAGPGGARLTATGLGGARLTDTRLRGARLMDAVPGRAVPGPAGLPGRHGMRVGHVCGHYPGGLTSAEQVSRAETVLRRGCNLRAGNVVTFVRGRCGNRPGKPGEDDRSRENCDRALRSIQAPDPRARQVRRHRDRGVRRDLGRHELAALWAAAGPADVEYRLPRW